MLTECRWYTAIQMEWTTSAASERHRVPVRRRQVTSVGHRGTEHRAASERHPVPRQSATGHLTGTSGGQNTGPPQPRAGYGAVSGVAG